ncbi:hypothetical protein ACFY04_11905 [Streptomyces sp. NPDC001549]|uniref:hypothetical protein n=1 Tax=Streptomyces sp. NPDC001549 TaxID=3364586 RepID=UPI0036A48153
MNDSLAQVGPRKQTWSWRRRLAVGAGVFAGLCGLGYAVLLVLGMITWQRLMEHDTKCCWEENATPEWMAGVMGFQVPQAATDRRAGFKTSSQYDVGLLSFTVTTAEADSFLQPLVPPGKKMLPNLDPKAPGYTRSDGFTHLGLPEPETFTEGMRHRSVCHGDAQTPESKALGLCAKIYAHEFQPGATRIYLWAAIEGDIGKPPAP